MQMFIKIAYNSTHSQNWILILPHGLKSGIQ